MIKSEIRSSVVASIVTLGLYFMLRPTFPELDLSFVVAYCVFFFGFNIVSLVLSEKLSLKENPKKNTAYILTKTSAKFVLSLFFVLFLYLLSGEKKESVLLSFLGTYIIFMVADGYSAMRKV